MSYDQSGIVEQYQLSDYRFVCFLIWKVSQKQILAKAPISPQCNHRELKENYLEYVLDILVNGYAFVLGVPWILIKYYFIHSLLRILVEHPVNTINNPFLPMVQS